MNPLMLPVMLPVLAAFAAALSGGRWQRLRCPIAVAAALASFVVSCAIINQGELYTLPWVGFGFDFTLRIYPFAGFVLLLNCAAATLAFAYCFTGMRERRGQGWFYFTLLLSLGFANGAALADNLGMLLFFWLGLLAPAYMLAARAGDGMESRSAALKGLLLNSFGGITLLAGAAITGVLAGTMSISSLAALPIKIQGWGVPGLLFFCCGLLAKIGVFPFHTYEEENAAVIPVPAAFLLAALDKILGVYLLVRVCTEFYALTGAVLAYPFLLIAGALTVLAGAGTALVRGDTRRICGALMTAQSGYILVAVANGDASGALLQLCCALVFTGCLFFSFATVEDSCGDSRLHLLGGAFPALSVCAAACALGLAGLLPLGGTFAPARFVLEALHGGNTWLAWLLALGAFLNMAALLRVAHSFFAGPRSDGRAALSLSVCACIFAVIGLAGCLWFRLPSVLASLVLPGKVFEPAVFPSLHIALAALLPLLPAALLQWKFPGLINEESPAIKNFSERRALDPYNYAMHGAFFLGRGFYVIDRAFDFASSIIPACFVGLGAMLVSRQNGMRNGYYLAWLIFGLVLFGLFVSYYGVQQ
jgi:formate hydrogenlyase subunit 3/multisubunit Na+/H+ antiporter MnhD subunit